MSRVALGFVETCDNAGTIQAINAILKATNVEYVQRVEIGGSYVTSIVRGEVGAVKSAVDAEVTTRVGELVCINIIPSAHEEVFEQMGQTK